jgi:hypothetical protein
MGTTLVALLARRRNPYPSPRAWDYTVLLAPTATRPSRPPPAQPASIGPPDSWLDRAIPCAIRPESRSSASDAISINSCKYAAYTIWCYGHVPCLLWEWDWGCGRGLARSLAKGQSEKEAKMGRLPKKVLFRLALAGSAVLWIFVF